MKANYYKVTYKQTNGSIGELVVKARDAKEAIKNAKNVCYTGRDFCNAIQVTKQPTFADITGGHHSNRMNHERL